MTNIYKKYVEAWGPLPSVAPHSETAPGLTTGRVIVDIQTMQVEINKLKSALKQADDGLNFLHLYESS